MKPHRLLPLLAVGLCTSLFAANTNPDLAWPAVTSVTKPWSRWWWLGNIGTKEDFTVRMEQYAKAGLGGLEITPIYGVRGEESRFNDFLSPGFMAQLDHVLDEGKRLDLGIDMATGTGWPFGGKQVTPEIAARHVVTKTYTVKGGERLAETVAGTDTPIVRLAGPRKVTIGELKDPVVSNPNLQDLGLDQVRFPRPLQLQALVAYSESGDKVVLTDKVGTDGKLDWTAPASPGTWTLYAVFLGYHGKQVERAGPGGEGDVIDHFNSGALAKYLAYFDAAYAGHNANRLRAYFNDSYEVDDASGESNWTPHFFDEFKRRRGYDLRDELPAFFGKDTPEKNARVMSDHRETVSDLLLDEYTIPWAKWSATHHALIRNQAHGSPANILDLYAASSIPETEGQSVAGMKLASSAAHVTGKNLASSETATWLDEHWSSTLGDIKRRVDLMFLGGVNHNCYHGTVFSPPSEPWPGHHFYASVELDPSNSIWADADVLNAYVTRCQSFLQAGRPANDILLYYPIHDTWAQRGNGLMPHFGSNAGGRGAGAPGLSTVQELLQSGFTFDYISDRQMQNVSDDKDALLTGGNHYRVVLVPETKLMPSETLTKLFALADAGATVLFEKAMPADVTGLGNLATRRAQIQPLLAAVAAAPKSADGLVTLSRGKGRIIVGDSAKALLAAAKVARETCVDQHIEFERRADATGHLYFLVNSGTTEVSGWLPLATPAAAAAIFDPNSARSGYATTRQSASGATEVFMQLAPGETMLVKTFTAGTHAGAKYVFAKAKGEPVALSGAWSLRFADGGPTLPAAATMTDLHSWTELDGDAVKAFSGTAIYTQKFTCPIASGDVLLDLGNVASSARVKLNGREIATLIAPPWHVLVPRSALVPGENTLEIAVTNLAANRIAELDRRDPSWKKFYNTNYPARGNNRGPDGNFSAAKWTPRASGLLGPVRVSAVE